VLSGLKISLQAAKIEFIFIKKEQLNGFFENVRYSY